MIIDIWAAMNYGGKTKKAETHKKSFEMVK